MNDDVPELAAADFERAISSRLRKRIEDGHLEVRVRADIEIHVGDAKV